VLELDLECESYPIKAEGLRPDFARDGRVPFLDVAATLDPQSGQVCLLMLNRDLTGERELAVDWHDLTPRACSRARRSRAAISRPRTRSSSRRSWRRARSSRRASGSR
jgi:hypothetical protein